MNDKNSMLVHFQTYSKFLTETPCNFFCTELQGLDRLLKQESARKYLDTNQKKWMHQSATDLYVLFCLAALIFQYRQKFSPRGFLFLDHLNTLD